MAAKTRFVTSQDGTRIAVHTSGEGPPLVLVYGALSDVTYWRRLMPHLEGYQVLAMERRGRGESGDAAEYAVEREIEDVIAVLEAAGQQAFVFGHSAGAILCLLAARRRPELARRLVLYEPPLISATGIRTQAVPGFHQRIEQFIEAGDPDEAIITFFREGPGLTEEEIERQRGGALWQSLRPLAPTAAYDAQISYECRLERLVDATFSLPVLLLYGSVSPDWMTGGVMALAEGLGNAILHELPGQGHSAAFTGAELLAGEIRGFSNNPEP